MSQAAAAVTEAPPAAEKTQPRVPTKPSHESRLRDSLDNKLHSVNLELQRKGRIIPTDVKDVHSMASRIHARGQYCSANQALLLLRCCGSIFVDAKREERSKLALEMWELFHKMGKTRLDVSHYNALLKVKRVDFFLHCMGLLNSLCCFRRTLKTSMNSLPPNFSPTWNLAASSPTGSRFSTLSQGTAT
jgi:hypothetical protein